MPKLNIKEIISDIILRSSLILAFATFSFEKHRFEMIPCLPMWILSHQMTPK